MSPILSYKDDSLFYQVGGYDQPRTLLADRGEIRVGQRYQAEKLPLVLEDTKTDDRNIEELETITWTPDHGLTDKQIDQFLVVSRSIGTFARALDSSSSITQPSLHMSAASASRDVTLFHAMDTLHKYSYDIASAVSALVPSSGPVLCRDEMEEWSASEANIFEEALEKYGKDFAAIKIDFLPWKTIKNLIEYYYMWKTTDRYVQFQQKRLKAAEAEAKLKQGFIPNFDKPNSNPNALSEMKRILKGNMTNNGPEEFISGKPCESCLSSVSSQWFAWTSPSGSQARLCSQCWHYLKKFGGLKTSNHKPHDPSKSLEGDVEIVKKLNDQIMDVDPLGHGLQMQQRVQYRCAIAGCNKDFKMKNQLRQHYATSHGSAVCSGSPRPIMKTRTAFYLHTTPLTKIARRVCHDLLKRHTTRSPFWPVNPTIKQEFLQRIIGKSPEDLKQIITGRKRKRPNSRLSDMAHRLGQPDRVTPDWLILTEKSKMPQPAKVAFPKPPKGKDGSLLYERIPDKVVSIVSPSLLKRKVYEEVGEMDGLESGQPALKKVARESEITATVPPKSSVSPLPLTVQNLPATATMNSRNVMHQRGRGGEGTRTKISSGTRLGSPKPPPNGRVGSRKHIISWMDAPDDLYFYRTEGTKKIRRTLKSNEIRRLARSPCKKVINQAVAAMTELFPPKAVTLSTAAPPPPAPLDNL